MQRNIWVFAAYISSRENSEADTESRSLKTNTEFELTEKAFYKVISKFGTSEISQPENISFYHTASCNDFKHLRV